MKLIHYTNEKFSLEPRKYEQSELSWQAKPNGLWFSVEGPNDWKWWCLAESFNIQNLVVSYEVKLKEDAKILHLKSADEVLNFSKLYPYLKKQWDNPEGRRICGTYEIDWDKVKPQYQGIIISPYQWNCRMSQKSCWYYGWDCSSGCVWDLDCIEEFKLKEKENNEINRTS